MMVSLKITCQSSITKCLHRKKIIVFQEIAMILNLLRMLWKVEELARKSIVIVLAVKKFCFPIALSITFLRSAAKVPGIPGQPALAHSPDKTVKLWNTPRTTSSIAVALSYTESFVWCLVHKCMHTFYCSQKTDSWLVGTLQTPPERITATTKKPNQTKQKGKKKRKKLWIHFCVNIKISSSQETPNQWKSAQKWNSEAEVL